MGTETRNCCPIRETTMPISNDSPALQHDDGEYNGLKNRIPKLRSGRPSIWHTLVEKAKEIHFNQFDNCRRDVAFTSLTIRHCILEWSRCHWSSLTECYILNLVLMFLSRESRFEKNNVTRYSTSLNFANQRIIFKKMVNRKRQRKDRMSFAG